MVGSCQKLAAPTRTEDFLKNKETKRRKAFHTFYQTLEAWNYQTSSIHFFFCLFLNVPIHSIEQLYRADIDKQFMLSGDKTTFWVAGSNALSNAPDHSSHKENTDFKHSSTSMPVHLHIVGWRPVGLWFRHLRLYWAAFAKNVWHTPGWHEY